MSHTLPTDLSTSNPKAWQAFRLLSEQELRFYRAWELEPQSAKLNTGLAFDLQGPLNTNHWSWAIQSYAKAHPESQCYIQCFDDTPGFVQHQQPIRLAMACAKLTDRTQWLTRFQHTPFDLKQGPLCRFLLLKHDEQHHTLLVGFHHVIADAHTARLFIEHLTRCGMQRPPKGWQQPPVSWTKTEPPHNPISMWQHHQIDAAQLAQLKKVAKQHGTSLFVLLLTLWAYLHSKTNAKPTVYYPANQRSTAQNNQHGCMIAPKHFAIDTSTTTKLSTLLKQAHHLCQQNKRRASTQAPITHLVSWSAIDQHTFSWPKLKAQAIALPTGEACCQSWLALDLGQSLTVQCLAGTPHTDLDASRWLHAFLDLLSAICLQPNNSHLPPAPQVQSQAANSNTSHPGDATTFHLQQLWARCLGHDAIDPNTSWAMHGGASLASMQLIEAINAHYGCHLPSNWLLQHPTLASQAEAVRAQAIHGNAPLLMQHHQGKHGTLIMVHPGLGGDECYAPLLGVMHKTHTTLASINNPHLSKHHPPFHKLAAMAQHYVSMLTTQYPPPYTLLGWSLGGVIAHSMAHLMETLGKPAQRVILLDAHALKPHQLRWTHYFLKHRGISHWLRGPQSDYWAKQPKTRQSELIACGIHELNLLKQHNYPTIHTPVTLYKASQSPYWSFKSYTRIKDNGWASFCQNLAIIKLPCDHFTMMTHEEMLKCISAHAGA